MTQTAMTTSLTKSSDKYILSTTSTGTSAAPYPSAHTVIASTIFSAIESLDSVLSTQGAQRLEVRKNRERIEGAGGGGGEVGLGDRKVA